MYEPTMIILAISSEFLNFSFEFGFLKWICIFHLSIHQCIKESPTGSINFRTNAAKVSLDDPIKIIFFDLSWIIIVLPCARCTCNYFGLAAISHLGSIYPIM